MIELVMVVMILDSKKNSRLLPTLKNNLTLELTLIEQTHVNVTIVDLLGNTIANISDEEMNAGSNKLHWNASNVANGIYLLNIKTNNSLQTKKLVLNK